MSNTNKSRCAYCRYESQLTREHVVPNFLYKANPSAKFGYNVRADKFMIWEAQVKDVCANCNNNYLSKVDFYAKQFFKENHIEKMITEEKSLRITYNYSWLTRVLLKITYNNLRLKGENTVWIESFRDYILHGTNFPFHYRIKVGVEVVPCHRITEKERAGLTGEAKNWKYQPPHMIRIGNIQGIFGENVFARYVFVNNFCFYYIACSEPETEEKLKTAKKQLSLSCPFVLFLHPYKTSATVKVSNASALDRYAYTGAMLSDKWTEYLNNGKYA